MVRSPWLGPLAILIAGVVGYALSDGDVASRLDAVTITIAQTRENGAKWDFGGGLPDPQVRVEQAGQVLATCEAKDQLKLTCGVHRELGHGEVRVVVVDIDTTDHDAIGEATVALDGSSTRGGSLIAVEASLGGGGGPWQRFRALWIALAIGVAVATALGIYRRRHA